MSPLLGASPVKTIGGLWPDGMPIFENADEANRFFQSRTGLWNRMAKFQSGSPPLKLQKVGRIDTRETLHDAASLRVEELHDGFLHGFTAAHRRSTGRFRSADPRAEGDRTSRRGS